LAGNALDSASAFDQGPQAPLQRAVDVGMRCFDSLLRSIPACCMSVHLTGPQGYHTAASRHALLLPPLPCGRLLKWMGAKGGEGWELMTSDYAYIAELWYEMMRVLCEWSTPGIRDTYVYTYIHTYIHTYIRIYVYTYIHTYTHTYIHTYIHTYTYIALALTHHTYRA
jgi:hypothetical protein